MSGSEYFDTDRDPEGDDYEEIERIKKEMLDEEEKAQAEDQAHQEESKADDKRKSSEDRIEFAEITCPGCTYKETKPLDPPQFYTEFEVWKSKFVCPECGSTSCEIVEKKYRPIGLPKTVLEMNLPEFRDAAYYLINIKPIKYILAVKGLNHLVEAQIAVHAKDNIITYNAIHSKIFLTCIPVKIIKHKNPLEFLGSAQKYTFSFRDATGDTFTFAQKTLSEILSGLHDLGHVIQSDGAEGALGSMILAFKEDQSLENNEDIGYHGFFLDKNKTRIVSSGVDVLDPKNYIEKLTDALDMLQELKDRYSEKLDLLATTIMWGMIAPVHFIMKVKSESNYYLKALYWYGFTNASKSSSGKIALALDGHHNNLNFVVNFNRFDTIARVGQQMSRSTFPLLIDESELHSDNIVIKSLVNSLKSAIDQNIVRSKFNKSHDLGLTDLPALSALIFTSNFSPPFYNSGFMRRVIDRNFPQNEIWKEDDPRAIEFKTYMTTNLGRLKALGDFRNWYIMNNQEKIIAYSSQDLLALGEDILVSAYEKIGRTMPDWLKDRVPERQLEQSMEDNETMVQRSFVKYINEEFRHNSYSFRTEDRDGHITIDPPPRTTYDRLIKLVNSDLLPDIRLRIGYGGFYVTRGILTELYKYGVTQDQIPNLSALADYVRVGDRKAQYKKSHGTMAVVIESNLADQYLSGRDQDYDET